MGSGDGISGNRTIPNVGTNGLGGDSWVVLLDTQGQKIREWAYPGYLFGLTVLGDGGIVFVEGLSVVRMDGDGTIVADPTSTNQVRRFYRARALDPQ